MFLYSVIPTEHTIWEDFVIAKIDLSIKPQVSSLPALSPMQAPAPGVPTILYLSCAD